MPDQIHNFAHNNEWLVRNLIYVRPYRMHSTFPAISYHCPNIHVTTTGINAATKYGRQRLIQTLTEYALWEELIKEAGGNYLPPTDDDSQQEEWLGWLAVAQFLTSDEKQGARTLRSLQRRSLALQTTVLDLEDRKADEEEKKSNDKSENQSEQQTEPEEEKPGPTLDQVKRHITQLDQILARVRTAQAVKKKDTKTFKEQLPKARLNPVIQAQWNGEIGQLDEGIKLAEKAVKDGPNQVRPLAVLTDLLWKKVKKTRQRNTLHNCR